MGDIWWEGMEKGRVTRVELAEKKCPKLSSGLN